MSGKQSRRVFVVGVGMTKFEKPGRREGWDYPDMVQEAGTKALKDAGIEYKEIQQVTVGYVYGDSTCGQRAIYSLGLTGVPVYNVNNNCSTGSTALFMARNLVAGGLADCVLAVGFEKMERGSLQAKWTDRTNPLDQHMNVMSEARGVTAAPFAPQMFGNAGVEHMERFGSTPEHMAKIAWKNHKHSGLNPYSQFQDEYSLEQILKSPKVFGPLTKLQCCPTSDGAAAAIIVSEDFVRKHGLEGQAVEIAGMSLATDLASSFQEKSCIKMVGFDMSKKAAEEAYAQAGIRPSDAQVVELHDCLATDHQILTSDGWLGLAELEQCEKEQRLPLVASYDQTRDALVYRPIDKLIVKPGGQLIELTHHNETPSWAPNSSSFGSAVTLPPTGQRQDADGRTLLSNHVSLLVTRNHDMVVRLGRASTAVRNRGTDKSACSYEVIHWSTRHGGAFHKVKAAELLDSDPKAAVKLIGAAGAGALPANDGRDAGELPFAVLGLSTVDQVNAFLELYGYWLGDGTLSYTGENGGVNGIQFAPVKERDQLFLDRVFAALPLKDAYRQPSPGARGERQYTIRDPAWFEVFDAEYGSKYHAGSVAQEVEEAALTVLKEADVVAPNIKSAKWFWWWVRRCLTRDQLRLIISGLWLADGSSAADQGAIFTSSIRFRDELQVVLLHAGYSSYFVNEYEAGTKRGVVRGKEVVARHHAWRVRYCEKADAHVVLRPATDIKPVTEYTDRVWCVNTAPYHTIIARRVHTEIIDGSAAVTKASRPVVVGNCFSANELVTYEAIGLAKQGEAHKLIDSGDNTYGGKWVVNPSGGLISKGHPLGATGLAQCAELTWQLRRMCGKRQVPNVKYAIQHNIGLGGAAVVSVYRLGFPDKLRPLAADAANPAIDASAIPRTKAGSTPKPTAAPSAAPAAAAPAAAAPAAKGPGSSLKSAAVFAELAKRIAADPSLVKKVNGIYLFKIVAGDQSASWTVDLKNGNGNIVAGVGEKADCTITMQDQDFVDLITGKLNGQQAFVQGKLKIAGNMGLAMKLSLLSASQKAKM